MSDVTRISGQAQTFPYVLRDAQNNLITPFSAPQQSIHASSADAGTGANPLSGPTALSGAAGSYTGTYPNTLAAGTYYLRTVTALTASTTLTDVDDRLILQTIIGNVGGYLATLADLKLHLNIDPAVTTFDTELQGFLDAATPEIESICGPILPVTITEDHYPNGPTLGIDQPPLLSVISLTEYRSNSAFVYTEIQNPTTASTYTFRVEPGGGGTIVRVFTGGRRLPFTGPVQVVYQAGMASVPADLRMAALEFARDLWQQTQQAPGGYGAAPGDDLGGLTSTPRWRVLTQRWTRQHQAVY